MKKGGKRQDINEGMAIFGEAKVDDYVIKPWTLKQVIMLTSVLKTMVHNLQENGIDFKDMNKEVDADLIMGLLEGIAPILPQIIAETLRFQSVSEAEDMEWGKAVLIGTQIFVLNWNHIKNFFGQIMGGVETIKMAEKMNESPSLQQ